MHRCFLVEDITNIICAELRGIDGCHNSSPERISVRNVALTSKLFLEPALKALWRFQASLEPLFLVLPESVWDGYDDNDSQDSQDRLHHDFNRILFASDLIRYRYYRDKIVTMNMQSEEYFDMWPSRNCLENIRRAFGLHHPTESYLPTPIVLDLGLHNDSGWIQYDLVSRKLQTLRIRRWSDLDENGFASVKAILSTLHIRAPNLNHLDIYDDPSSLLAQPVGTGLTHLQSFKCLDITTHAMIQGLASLPHLEFVDLHLPPEPLALPHSASWVPHFFPSLRTLKITADQVSSAARFIQLYMFANCAENIHISIDWKAHLEHGTRSAPPFEGLQMLFKHERFTQCLTAFNICTYIEYDEPLIPPPSITFSAIAPLLSCSCLERLVIDGGYTLEGFDDSALQTMAAAWPQLRSLRIVSYPRDTKPMLCTVKCLKYFAHSCQHLADLKIRFSPNGYRNIPKAGPRDIQHRLISLDVQFSPIPPLSIPTTASFLKRLFPKLLHIGTASTWREDGVLAEMRDAWKEVMRLHHLDV